MPSQRPSVPPAPGSGSLPDSRRSVPPPSMPGADAVSIAACSQLLDRLAAADEAPFIAAWIEGVLSGRDPHRLRPWPCACSAAYRETGRIDRARDLAASLPSAPSSWNPLDSARLAIERAILATIDGRGDHAEAELRLASRALSAAPKGTGLREQLDMHLTQAQLELKLNRVANAANALRLAEHVAERLEDGAWRAPVAMTLGHLSMRLADPRTAAKHYATALARAPARGTASMSAHGNLAIALGSIGRFDEGRYHATQAIGIARELAAGWRHADAHDVLAIVEIAADRPLVGAARHRRGAGRARRDRAPDAPLPARRAPHLGARDARARAGGASVAGPGREAAGGPGGGRRHRRARLWWRRARARSSRAGRSARRSTTLRRTAEKLPEAFVTGSLNLVVGRCALTLGDEARARARGRAGGAVGREARLGVPRSPVVAGPLAARAAQRRQPGRAVRRADDRAGQRGERGHRSAGSPPSARQSAARISIPPSSEELDALPEPSEGETLIYVTTPTGVTRVPVAEMSRATQGATLVVDTLAHHLRVHDREVSLERRRALEPLVVQLLRRAKEGLSADEILRAAGGPGPESADAEHRVRVLISRVRDLLGDPAAIERVRDAGEYGRTRYRLAPTVRFALVEPLFSSNGS